MAASRKALVVPLLLVLALLFGHSLVGAEAKARKKGQTKAPREAAAARGLKEAAARDFYGRSIAHVANLVRAFNAKADTGAFDGHSLYQYRKEMTNYGLGGTVAHVGHVVSRKKGGRDRGANLMALPASDNWTLGEKIVPCDMAAYWNRLNVDCERLGGAFVDAF